MQFIKANLDPANYYQLYFEDLIAQPQLQVEQLSEWLKLPVTGSRLVNSVDEERASLRQCDLDGETLAKITSLLLPLYHEVGHYKIPAFRR